MHKEIKTEYSSELKNLSLDKEKNYKEKILKVVREKKQVT